MHSFGQNLASLAGAIDHFLTLFSRLGKHQTTVTRSSVRVKISFQACARGYGSASLNRLSKEGSNSPTVLFKFTDNDRTADDHLFGPWHFRGPFESPDLGVALS